MAYFANGSDGDEYEARFCDRCQNQDRDDASCPVWTLHLLWNYDQNDDADKRMALDLFIPVIDGRNGTCAMFAPLT